MVLLLQGIFSETTYVFVLTYQVSSFEQNPNEFLTKGQLRVSLKQVAKCLVIVGFESVKLMFIIGDPNHYDRSRNRGAVDLEKFKIWG